MYPIIMSQGIFVHKDSLTFPIEERGLQFGDGVYEVIRIYSGRPYLLAEHLDRLLQSLEAIRISIPYEKKSMYFCLKKLLKRNRMEEDGYLYVQVTRGSAPRTHHFPENSTPNMFAYVKKLKRDLPLLKNGVCAMTARDERWENCYIKSINLLPNVLARQTAYENGCYEAILHRNENVTSCTSANLFLVNDGKIYTHPATKHIVHGCIRHAVKRFAKKLQIPFIEATFSLAEIETADELFLTSSISEVLAIVAVDGKPIGDGRRGPITEKILAAYEEDARLTISETV